MCMASLLSSLCESRDKSSDISNEVFESGSEDYVPESESDWYEVVCNVISHVKSVIVSDGSSVSSFEFNDNVDDGNAEHNDSLQVVDRYWQDIQMIYVGLDTLKHPARWSLVGVGKGGGSESLQNTEGITLNLTVLWSVVFEKITCKVFTAAQLEI